MFVGITNTPRRYAWGSTTAIAQLLGHEASGSPEAELWLGAHPGSPSVILDPTRTGGATTLDEWIAADPQTTLGRFAASGRLPFLLKVLAAGSPLSLQAHPTLEQARAGFARENDRGIDLDAPERNYKDAFPKPELIYALSPTFDALCGFRPLEEVRALLLALIGASLSLEDPQPQPLEDLLEALSGSDGALPQTFEWLIGQRTGVATLVSLVVTLAHQGVAGYEPEMATVVQLADNFPGDPGIVISLLLNRVTLAAGEALYLPAGNIHAYLNGLGVELMAASDNVLRGGLTPKHIDVPELLDMLDFTPVAVPYLHSTSPSEGVAAFTPDVADFELLRIDGMFLDASVALTGPAIALCTAGDVSIAGAASSWSLVLGDSVYITPDEAGLRFTGSGTVFVATTGALA
ncbi:mannose-6-phosphate isomerase, class I [Frigoribacterium sp. CG_9.8]|uniref:mannose-6-phosphate isomerase, class I n=1 Tax=Frigoribacterium sp. CG_9.8 TaxID=2787733 RepID=UPI0018CBBF5A|nr:mannose-6-phosphate isomerase, class I [Frigoribacterium sp. CG_9.8]MBG6106768.1 mannose-6-phosphate isomerase [Frigoribacterium sp. CG_9.8]